MEIISKELEKRNVILSGDTDFIIKRVIHTTADFDYAQNIRFSPEASVRGIEALRRGTVIVTDTNMALAGINENALKKLSSAKICFMADKDVADEAKERSITRAAVSVERAAGMFKSCIYAVGNAPTALYKLADIIEEGFRPDLVIAVPVGFVNVTEAKEHILKVCGEYDVPCIAAMGRKGGSTVAAAICNALIYRACGMR